MQRKLQSSRRAFLADVGQGMFVASLGYAGAVQLGLATARAGDEPPRLHFGAREPLVALLEETPIDRLLLVLVERMRQGTTLDDLVAAAALANARMFGGEDYVGFHSFMALAPAWRMAGQLPESQRALPVLKVLYRNSNRIQEKGGPSAEVLHPLTDAGQENPSRDAVRQAIRARDLPTAERMLAAAVHHAPEDAFNDLLPVIADGAEVHRTVLAYRAWDLLELAGREHALTFLRQSLHYCVDACRHPSYEQRFAPIRELLPRLLDQYRLEGLAEGTRTVDDAWIDAFRRTVYEGPPDRAADAVAAALADGVSPECVGEAISLAANQLVLCDPGRPERWASPNKPVGSVHGDSTGVHASDSINAWRNMARLSERKNAATCLILAAWQVAQDRVAPGSDYFAGEPRPNEEQRAAITAREPDALLRELDDAIRQKDQIRACAAVTIYGEQNLPAAPVIDRLLQYAVSEDGALHAEKYFRTATEEFSRTREALRWQHLTSLARVTASAFGQPAPGLAEARRLLGV